MTRLRARAALAATTTVVLAAACTAALTIQSASAAPTEADPVTTLLESFSPKSPTPEGNSPGTGGDAYKEGDPFVDQGKEPTNIPPGTIIAQSFKFFPGKINATPGQEITLDNQDVAIHNVQTDGKKPTIKSADAESKQKVTFKAPMKPGKYEAFCFYHQSMIVDIIVK